MRVDCIDLYQVHVPDPDVPYAEIPGTSKITRADDNVDAAWLDLTGVERERFDAVGASTAT